mgnify:CR=1 FL=1
MFGSTIYDAFARAVNRSEEKGAEKEREDFSGCRVLLADDNELNREIARTLLEMRGMEVETAEDGQEAADLYSPEGPDIFPLCSWIYACCDGRNRATRRIRTMERPDSRTIPIIAMTANAFDDDIEKSKAAGMNAHLAKPIEPERMYQTLYDFIYGKEA